MSYSILRYSHSSARAFSSLRSSFGCLMGGTVAWALRRFQAATTASLDHPTMDTLHLMQMISWRRGANVLLPPLRYHTRDPQKGQGLNGGWM